MKSRLSPDILKKIKHIEISTRRLLNSSLMGDTRSAIKGTGFEFDQIREYQMGDDIRSIDWSSSARMHKLLVKQYIEERNRTIIIALDVSASNKYTSTAVVRSDIMAQLASILALVGEMGKDSVGLLLFSDDVELYIRPNRGRSHSRMIMEKAFTHQARHRKTNIARALDYIAQQVKKDAMICFISDFIDEHDFAPSLKRIAHSHDLIALRCLDEREKQMSALGFLTIEDAETGTSCMLDLRSVHGAAQQFLHHRLEEQTMLFKKCGIDFTDIYLSRPFIGDIVRLFRYRMMY